MSSPQDTLSIVSPSQTASARPTQYEVLKAALLAGEFGPGALLHEMALSTRFGVSRTPVREALQRLESEGLIVKVGRSYQVRTATPEEILDLYEVRIALEASAASAAARRRDEIDLVRLEAAVALEEDSEGGVQRVFDANLRFHDLVSAASHNAYLQRTVATVRAHITLLDRIPVANQAGQGEIWREHSEILTAVTDRDGVRAGELMANHLSRTRDLRIRSIAHGLS